MEQGKINNNKNMGGTILNLSPIYVVVKRVFEGPLVKFGVTVSVTPIAAVSDSKLNSPGW